MTAEIHSTSSPRSTNATTPGKSFSMNGHVRCIEPTTSPRVGLELCHHRGATELSRSRNQFGQHLDWDLALALVVDPLPFDRNVVAHDSAPSPSSTSSSVLEPAVLGSEHLEVVLIAARAVARIGVRVGLTG